MGNDTLALAQKLNESGAWQGLPAPVQTALFLGGMVLLPAALVCLTSFTRIVIVLSFVRRAVTTQEIPPNMVIVGLSLFLTLFVMGPTIEEIEKRAIAPHLAGKMEGYKAVEEGLQCLKEFMLRQTRKHDLALFIHMANIKAVEEPKDTPFRVLIPAFVISELKTAFIMGFLIYLPFLLVDLVISSVLTAMGMMMMPPVVISAPFKLLLFVLADGWHLIARSLSMSFG